ncbi:MaoC/PaaZ C-terminal domain-containing protein [Pseudomonas sp. HK3]
MEALENKTYDEIALGDQCVYKKTLTEADLILFAVVSGDVNPVHLDEEFARNSVFKERIAHGMWSGSLVSATLATVMPGPGTIYLNQSLNFLRPVKLGDTLSVKLTAQQKNDEKHTVVFNCEVVNQDGKRVLEGEAKVIAPTKKIIIAKPELPKITIGGPVLSEIA